MSNTQFTFTPETLAQLVTVSANKNAAVALAAKEAAAAKLTQREFGAALQNASASLGCQTAIYAVALRLAKEGASLENIEKGMASKASEMREAARAKREENEAKRKTDKAATDDGGIGNLKNLTPLEQAKEAVEKASQRVLECKEALRKAESAAAAALVTLAAVEKAENAAALELKAMEDAKKEVAPIMAIVSELKPLPKSAYEEGMKARKAERLARKVERMAIPA